MAGAGVLLGDAGSVPEDRPDDRSGEPVWQTLPRATLRAWRLDDAVGLGVALAVLGLVAVLGQPAFAQRWLLPAAGLAVVAAVVEAVVILPRRHRSYRYRVNPGSVVVESGAVVRRELVVPLHQVLYVETESGPVLRAYGLTRVRLGTIADPKSVGPVTPDAAEVLRAAVEASRRPGPAEEPG